MLYRLGRRCVRRAVVVAVWLFLAVAVHVVVWRVGAETSNGLSLPGTESQEATDLLASAMVLSLAPALLTLFGAGVWWLPRWLARVLPHVNIEGRTSGRRPSRASTCSRGWPRPSRSSRTGRDHRRAADRPGRARQGRLRVLAARQAGAVVEGVGERRQRQQQDLEEGRLTRFG